MILQRPRAYKVNIAFEPMLGARIRFAQESAWHKNPHGFFAPA